MSSTELKRVVKYRGASSDIVDDILAVEAPLEIRLGGVPLAVVMRTPGADPDLIRGFAVTEGIVLGLHEVADVVPVPGDEEGNRWELVLADGVVVDPEQFRRNLYTTSSCGVCGKASIDAVRVAAPPLPAGPTVALDTLLGLPDTMRRRQDTFAATGGLHAAASFDGEGNLLVLREDIGRHNAVDKVIGSAAGFGPILMVSGRISFEILQKAGVAGIPIVCGISAASSLAVDLADELGMTTVGFLRDGGCNVYTGAARIEGAG